LRLDHQLIRFQNAVIAQVLDMMKDSNTEVKNHAVKTSVVPSLLVELDGADYVLTASAS
jgi:hypothetical protein